MIRSAVEIGWGPYELNGCGEKKGAVGEKRIDRKQRGP